MAPVGSRVGGGISFGVGKGKGELGLGVNVPPRPPLPPPPRGEIGPDSSAWWRGMIVASEDTATVLETGDTGDATDEGTGLRDVARTGSGGRVG